MPERPEVFYTVSTARFDVVEKPLSPWEKLYENGAVRKSALLVILAAVWELYARWLGNPLLFPTFSATVGALFDRLRPEPCRRRPSIPSRCCSKDMPRDWRSRRC